MSTPGVPLPGRVVTVALLSVSLLSLLGGLLTAPTPPAAADPPPRLRLEPVGDSGVSEVSRDLGPLLQQARPAGRRTAPLATTGHTMLALTWRGQAPDMSVRSRTAGEWGRWSTVDPLTDLPDATDASRTAGSQLVWLGAAADGVQVSVRGPVPVDLELVLIDPGVRAADDAPARPRASRSLEGATETDDVPRPDLRTRRNWGADEDWRTSRPRYNTKLKQVHVHHTVNSNGYSRSDVPALIRGMYRYHTHHLGWSDLGYNFLVDRFGRTWVGRAGGPDRRVRGAHTLGFNHSSTGVAVIGNLEQRRPRRDVVRAVARLAAWKLDREGRDAVGKVGVRSQGSDRFREGRWVRLPVIDGHRDTNHTACPGEHLYDRLPAIRMKAQRRIDRH